MSTDLKTLNPTYEVTIQHQDAGNNFLQNNGTYLTNHNVSNASRLQPLLKLHFHVM